MRKLEIGLVGRRVILSMGGGETRVFYVILLSSACVAMKYLELDMWAVRVGGGAKT